MTRHPAFLPRRAREPKEPARSPNACPDCAGLPHRRPENAPCPGCGGLYAAQPPIPRPDPWDRGASPLGAASDQAIGALGIGQSSAAAKAMKTPGKDTSAWSMVRGNSPSHRAAK